MCINVKAKTIDKLPSFRGAFEKQRCVLPAAERNPRPLILSRIVRA